MLQGFSGTLLLVSHDREFLDNVVTSTIAFEEDGPHQYVGGYQDWLRQRPATVSTADKPARSTDKSAERKQQSSRPRKLTYGEELELAALPEKMENLEQRIEAVQQEMADPDFYQHAADRIAARTQELDALQQEMEAAFTRWEELESRA